MKKFLFLILLLILGVGIGYTASKIISSKTIVKVNPKPILKVALVTDSHNNNDLLAKALAQARVMHVDFVIGLGDYTNTGTVAELTAAKSVFDASGLTYYVTAGDHDLWDARNQEIKNNAGSALDNFRQIFGEPSHDFIQKKIHFVILDNSDIYKGIDEQGWKMLEALRSDLRDSQGLTLIFAHKTPYHPQSAHIMGEESPAVAAQAKQLIKLIEDRKIDGFFSGDLHFFANFLSPGQSASGGNSSGSVKMTTIGAVVRKPNPQGPRFGVLTIYDDYSWEVADVEIR